MNIAVYDISGKKKSSIDLPEEIFGVKWNSDLVHQVVTSLTSSARKPVAHTKTRGEVRGGGKKPWKQKGTGRARHGSTRSPIWVGGGVAHGPRNDKNFERKVSKKMKTKALYTVLSRKLRDGEILFVDAIELNAPKTREAVGAIKSLATVKGFETLFKKKKNAAVFLMERKENTRALKNLSNMEVVEPRNINILTLLGHKYLVIENPEKALSVFPKMK